MNVAKVWAIVPLKPLKRSKSRLAPVLDIKHREALSREMFEHTLTILTEVRSISGVLVISRDTQALSIARQMGAQTLQESGTPELNSSLTRATKVVSAWGANTVLVVASDVPLLQVDDIEAMVEPARHSEKVVVIAPDRHRVGTNALLMHPPQLMPYCFGEDSFNRHVEQARAIGAEVHVYESRTIGLDVDLPADLDLYRELLMDHEGGESTWLRNV